jgi:DNA-directed RNA polymerase subunit RPC12/RpoP
VKCNRCGSKRARERLDGGRVCLNCSQRVDSKGRDIPSFDRRQTKHKGGQNERAKVCLVDGLCAGRKPAGDRGAKGRERGAKVAVRMLPRIRIKRDN